jgi:phosphoglycerate dehydrogenase-like enzyme
MPTQTVFIASPLEAEHVARIRAVDPGVRVLYAPDLLPPTRYIADHKGAPYERTPEQTQRWRALLGEAEILWDFPAPDPADIAHAPRLRWVQTTSTGVGQAVAKLGLAERGILVTTARGVHARPLADFVFMVLLSQWRGLGFLQSEQRAHRWERYCGEGVAGRTLVTVGAGDLARGCARLAQAFDMRVIAVGRDPAKERAHNALFDEVRPIADLHAALAMADAVVACVPHTAATERLIDAAAFTAMRPGVIFVNIARGQVIDEAALIGALRDGRVGYAALDVAETEPLPPANPLWDMPNVLISPHSASTVTTENAAITGIFVHNLRCWLEGRAGAMRNVLDTRLMY